MESHQDTDAKYFMWNFYFNIQKMNFQLIFLLLEILVTNINIVQAILNGNVAVDEDFHYQVYLNSDCDSFRYCGGVILDELHILTAAHCVYDVPPHEITIYAGTYHLEVDDVSIRDVKEVHLPRGFVPGGEDTDDDELPENQVSYRDVNDIAVLTVAEPLTLGPRIKAVELPTEDAIPCSLSCKFSGWGVSVPNSLTESKTLLWYEPVVLKLIHCEKLGSPHADNEFCALDPRQQSTPLKGDSGGGLVCGGVLAGILSTGTPWTNVPAIYVKVYSFLAFINEIRESDQEDEEPIKKKRKMQRALDET